MADRLGTAFHGTHDRELVARSAAGDLVAGEAARARDLLASCDACAALAADLRAIAAATRAFGPAAARIPSAPAPRDFRLTPADAARLRRRGFLGVGRLAGSSAGRARGIGGALAALGLVGLLVSAGMPTLFSGTGGAATSESAAGAAAPAAADSMPQDSASQAAELAPAASGAYALTASEAPARVTDAVRDDEATATGWPAPLVIGSLAALLIGLSLVLAARNGRRTGP